MSDLEFTNLSAGELVDRMRATTSSTGSSTAGAGAHSRPNELDRAWQWSLGSDDARPDRLPAQLGVHRSVLDAIDSGEQLPGAPTVDGEPDHFYRFGDSAPSFGGRSLRVAGVSYRITQYDPHTLTYLATRLA